MKLVETPIGSIGDVRIESDTAPENLLTEPGLLRLMAEDGQSALFIGISATEAKRLATLCNWLNENEETRAGREVTMYVGDLPWAEMGERFERATAPQFK